jgi:hypothetical protein
MAEIIKHVKKLNIKMKMFATANRRQFMYSPNSRMTHAAIVLFRNKLLRCSLCRHCHAGHPSSMHAAGTQL